MIKAVLFDLGGVVVDFSNYSYYIHLSKISEMPTYKIREVIEKRQIDLLEKDKTDIRSFERHIAEKLDIPVKKVGWYDFYKRNASINPDVEELVEIMHKGYITAFISNIDKTRYVYTRRILNLNAFDYRFTSCYIGFRKPDPRIFRFVLNRIGIKPSEAIFIDNMIENVIGARKVGIRSFHFINRRLLDRELAKLRL